MDKPVTTIELKGRKLDVWLSDDGDFSATIDGTHVISSTLKGLKTKAAQRLRNAQARVAVRVVRVKVDPDTHMALIERLVLTGLHAGHDAVLFRKDRPKGKTGQLDVWSYQDELILRNLTDDEFAKCRRLHAEAATARRAIKAFIDSCEINPKKEVQAAIDEAAAEVGHD